MKKGIIAALIALVVIVGLAVGVAYVSLHCGQTSSPTTQLNSSDQNHWVNVIDDTEVFWPNSAAMYANLWGFDEGPGQTYWMALDIRTFFIPIADFVLKFKNKETFDRYWQIAQFGGSDVLKAVECDKNMRMYRGEINTNFIFRWGNDDRNFDVYLPGDMYAEEK